MEMPKLSLFMKKIFFVDESHTHDDESNCLSQCLCMFLYATYCMPNIQRRIFLNIFVNATKNLNLNE